MDNWVDICWDEIDGLPVDHPDHIWGATGCTEDVLDRCIEYIHEGHPNVTISLFFDGGTRYGLKQHLAETGRSL